MNLDFFECFCNVDKLTEFCKVLLVYLVYAHLKEEGMWYIV